MRVTSIGEYRGRDIVEALSELLEEAKEGHLKGFAFVVKTGGRDHQFGLTGDYWRDPYQALGCVTRMEFTINELISARHQLDQR